MVKNLPANAGDARGLDPWVGKMPWRRKWQLIPVFLPGESHKQRSLVGYSPWSCKRISHDLVTKPPPNVYFRKEEFKINELVNLRKSE